MNKIILTLLACLAWTPLAIAAAAQDFDYNGITANDYELIGWNSIGGTDGDLVEPNAVGDLGVAEQFTITKPTYITALDITAKISPDSVGSTTITWDIYNASTNTLQNGQPSPGPIPLLSSLSAQSKPITFTESDTQAAQTVTEKISLRDKLQPGTYWIAEQSTGPGNAAVYPSQEYIGHSPKDQNFPTAAVPELPTAWILAIGVSLLFLRKKCPILSPFTRNL